MERRRERGGGVVVSDNRGDESDNERERVRERQTGSQGGAYSQYLHQYWLTFSQSTPISTVCACVRVGRDGWSSESQDKGMFARVCLERVVL